MLTAGSSPKRGPNALLCDMTEDKTHYAACIPRTDIQSELLLLKPADDSDGDRTFHQSKEFLETEGPDLLYSPNRGGDTRDCEACRIYGTLGSGAKIQNGAYPTLNHSQRTLHPRPNIGAATMPRSPTNKPYRPPQMPRSPTNQPHATLQRNEVNTVRNAQRHSPVKSPQLMQTFKAPLQPQKAQAPAGKPETDGGVYDTVFNGEKNGSVQL